jgi:hypothetical protein
MLDGVAWFSRDDEVKGMSKYCRHELLTDDAQPITRRVPKVRITAPVAIGITVALAKLFDVQFVASGDV